MKITIHEEKNSHFTFHGEKKGRSRVTKIPFPTLITETVVTCETFDDEFMINYG